MRGIELFKMKKTILSVIFLTITLGVLGCTNPSMDDGFERLNKSLRELELAIESLNIPQMEADLTQMNSDVADMIATAEELQGSWDIAITQFQAISDMLDEMLENSDEWATTEQMQELLENVQEFGDGVDTLVLAADYDHDGVINAIDQCPDTPLTQVNNVNAQGCATGETPVSNGD